MRIASKRKRAVKAACAIAAAGALIAGALYLSAGGGAEKAVLGAQGKQAVKVTVAGEGVDGAEVMPIVYLKKVDSQGNREASWLHQMSSPSEEYILDSGTYEVTLGTSPVLSDGTLYRFDDGESIADNSFDHTEKTAGRAVTFDVSKVASGEGGDDARFDVAYTALLTYKAENGIVQPLTSDDGVAAGSLYGDTYQLLEGCLSKIDGYQDASSLRDVLAESMIQGRSS